MAYNILIVDDSSVVRKVLMRTFGMAEVPVSQFFEAANGAEGLEVLDKNWIDIVFLDINMPVMNGMEFMERIRESTEHKDLPVVVISTEGSQERIETLTKNGIKAYLRKPTTPEAIAETIVKVLGEIKK